MHIEEVARAAGLQRSTAVYHLRTLVRHGQLVAMDGAKSVHYYPVGTTRDEASRTRLALLSSPRTRAVAEHVRDHPGLTRAELAAKVGIAASTLSWHLGRLLEAGLVVDDRAPSGHVVARPAEGLAEMLAPWKGAPATAPVESPVPVAALAAPAA